LVTFKNLGSSGNSTPTVQVRTLPTRQHSS